MDVTDNASKVSAPIEGSPLLDTLIESAIAPSKGSAGIVAALRTHGIGSVLDIARMTRRAFIQQLGKFNINDEDAGRTYDIAQGYVAQLDRLYRQQQVSPVLMPARPQRAASEGENTRKAGLPTYQKLFKEPWSRFCSSDSIAANDSPVAYLRALYLFAMQLENRGVGIYRLDRRRPDLKTFLIDSRTTFNQVPMLSIVNKILEEQTTGIRGHLNTKQYPYSLPYDPDYHACVLGLKEKQTQLGELNHQTSQRLLAFSPAQDPKQEVRRAQQLLSGLSPAQMKLLSAPPNVGEPLYKDNFNLALPSGKEEGEETRQENLRMKLSQVNEFLDRTQLNADQLQALLAQKTHAPHQSPAVTGKTSTQLGARYVNGTGKGHNPMGLSTDTLTNTTHDRFDRLHRMIRLQRWLAIPFAELDTLLTSAMEWEKNTAWTLSDNTLRVLGVFRYWNRVHGAQAEEFAALLFRIPTHATGRRVSLFDRLFRSPGTAPQAWLYSDQTLDAPTRQRLCAALGLSDTADSLELLIANTPSQEKESLPAAISAIYRRTRVAKWLGLTVQECHQLLELLPETYQEQWAAPSLGRKDAKDIDYLDVLMRLDWITRWMRESHVSVSDLRRQMIKAPAEIFPSFNPPQKKTSDNPPGNKTPDGQTAKDDTYDDLLQANTRTLIPDLIKTYLGTETKPSDTDLLKYLLLLMPNAERDLQLPVSGDTLLYFMQHPKWLDDAYKNEKKLELSLHDLYLLHRVRHYVNTYGRPEAALLEYFEWAHSPAADKKQADTRLATLLGWNQEDVAALTNTLGWRVLTAMNQIDWLIRCQHACLATGFSAETLLKARKLDRDSTPEDWKALAEVL
ncbi:Tc toxin subunit A [Pseudomonas sp. T1.Ur]|uniref:Tc toxin subunit A n=1 Tax=Pseudomonas sp. T1.Ur TaxID=2928704 RepID=UPI00201E0F82|nr:Tc toxin subunit A [Pseudomonas sp. T1.Ur]MCL6703593.1 Tc toxin subunit A [Pseudomonas sp. T1.Ur]